MTCELHDPREPVCSHCLMERVKALELQYGMPEMPGALSPQINGEHVIDQQRVMLGHHRERIAELENTLRDIIYLHGEGDFRRYQQDVRAMARSMLPAKDLET